MYRDDEPAWPAPPMGQYGQPDWSDEADRQGDISERYAGERIPPFDHIEGVDPWTGRPL